MISSLSGECDRSLPAQATCPFTTGSPGSLAESSATAPHTPRSGRRERRDHRPVVRNSRGRGMRSVNPASAQRCSAIPQPRIRGHPAGDQQCRHAEIGRGAHGLAGEHVGDGLLEAGGDIGGGRVRVLLQIAGDGGLEAGEAEAKGSSRGPVIPRGKTIASRSPVRARSSSALPRDTQAEQARDLVVGLPAASSTVLPSSTIGSPSERTCSRLVCPPETSRPMHPAAGRGRRHRRPGARRDG